MQRKRDKYDQQMEKKKQIKEKRVKPFTSTGVIDLLIGNKKQNGKQEKERQGVGTQPSYPGPFDHHLQPVWIIWGGQSFNPLPQPTGEMSISSLLRSNRNRQRSKVLYHWESGEEERQGIREK